jgi:hypothetical protein
LALEKVSEYYKSNFLGNTAKVKDAGSCGATTNVKQPYQSIKQAGR